MAEDFRVGDGVDLRTSVFVLPLFEVKHSAGRLPSNKSDLAGLYRERRAFVFHAHTCRHCQRFPGVEAWVANADLLDAGGKDKDSIFVTTKRAFWPLTSWEPIFICTQGGVPPFNERLSWEGRKVVARLKPMDSATCSDSSFNY